MACVSEIVQQQQIHSPRFSECLPSPDGFMQKFRLYETRSNFYIVGRDKSRTFWKVLKIDRSEPWELNIREDSTTYNEKECSDLLRRIHEGNKVTGGLKFVTTCYGIVGFIKFLGPYYMLIITKRKAVGAICGHNVYTISKSAMIPLSNSALRSTLINTRIENRYKKLLCMVNLTKDFYFSYSYNVMRSLQKNICEIETGKALYETMFVWNEFLTRGIRNILQNTIWTVALVYGFFKQVTISVSGRDVKLTLIARRSRHYAGTRYLKRGVNEKGKVANDVETEQIVMEDVPEGIPVQVSSVVQNRGSIPLFWSQEASRINLKPDIILSKKDQTYEATRLHFEDLVERYGNPVIIFNLIKTTEKKPRESVLRAEFANAIEAINKDLSEESQLRFVHLDLHKYSHSSKAKEALLLLGKVATYALTLTGFFCFQATPDMLSDQWLKWSTLENFVAPSMSDSDSTFNDGLKPNDNESESIDSDEKASTTNSTSDMNPTVKPLLAQKGVLRTNCIDCLDRTNVAQFSYGLVALGHQLHTLGLRSSTKMDLEDPLVEELIGCYEKMGDTLAHQYSGSAAHNKIFSERRGQWKAATQSLEFFRTIQRYYSNSYVDEDKQRAINVFLGNFQPKANKTDVSDQSHGMSEPRLPTGDKSRRSLFRRSFSDGNILHENSSSSTPDSESAPEISAASQVELAYSRCMPAIAEMQRDRYSENECSNFVDLDWLSSSGNSCEEDSLERSLLEGSPTSRMSSENIINPPIDESVSRTQMNNETEVGFCEKIDYEAVDGFSDTFVQWVTYGEALFH